MYLLRTKFFFLRVSIVPTHIHSSISDIKYQLEQSVHVHGPVKVYSLVHRPSENWKEGRVIGWGGSVLCDWYAGILPIRLIVAF